MPARLAQTLSRSVFAVALAGWLPTIFLPLVSGPVPALIMAGLPIPAGLAWAAWYRFRLAPPQRATVRALLRYDADLRSPVRWAGATLAFLLATAGLVAVRVNRPEPVMWIMFVAALAWAVVLVASMQSGGHPLRAAGAVDDTVVDLKLRWLRATALLTFVPWGLATEPAPWSERATAGTIVLVLLAGYVTVSWLRDRHRPVRPPPAIVEVLVRASPAATPALILFIVAAAYLPWQMPEGAMAPVFLVVAVAWLWLPFGLVLGLWRLARRAGGRPGRRVAAPVVPRR